MSRKRTTVCMSNGNSLGETIIAGLKELSEALEKRPEQVAKEFSLHTVSVSESLEPGQYTASDVQAVRRSMRASQTLFAAFLGVSVQSIRAWEQGVNAPSGAASRFMDEIRVNESYFAQRFKRLTKPKRSPRAKRAAEN